MSHAQPFTPEEIERLNQLEMLMSYHLKRPGMLRHALTPALQPRLWAELLGRVEQQEFKKLSKLNKRIDLKKAVVRGVAWKTHDGRLDCTWPDANDGKIAAKGALPILFVVDLPTSQLQPHRELREFAECMLGVSSSRDFSSDSGKFLQQLHDWQLLAEKNFARKRSRSELIKELECINTLEDADGRRMTIGIAKKLWIIGVVKAAAGRKQSEAHNLATDLWVICNDIRKAVHAPQHELEDRFGLLNQALTAARLADRLTLVAIKANTQRSLKLLEKKGRKESPFVEAVRSACEICWSEKPGIRPSGKAVLLAMKARIVERNQIPRVEPRKLAKVDWEPSPLTSFQKIVGTWAAEKGLKLSGSMRPKKGEELPKPEPF